MGNISRSRHVSKAGYLPDMYIDMRLYLYNDQKLFLLHNYDQKDNVLLRIQLVPCSYSNLQSFNVYCSTGSTTFHDHIIST